MTQRIIIQPQFVAIATLDGPDGKPIFAKITQEWHRPLEQMAKLVNQQQDTIADLTARIVALGG